MPARSARPWIPLVARTAIFIVGCAVIWSWAPESVRGVLLLTAGVLTAAFYGALSAVQRRRHWVRQHG